MERCHGLSLVAARLAKSSLADRQRTSIQLTYGKQKATLGNIAAKDATEKITEWDKLYYNRLTVRGNTVKQARSGS